LFSVLFGEIRANFVSFFVSFLTSRGASMDLLSRFDLSRFCDGGAFSARLSDRRLLPRDAWRASFRALLVAARTSGMLNQVVADRI
jgi:hypothetical protein